jgi:hypothetical protein
MAYSDKGTFWECIASLLLKGIIPSLYTRSIGYSKVLAVCDQDS